MLEEASVGGRKYNEAIENIKKQIKSKYEETSELDTGIRFLKQHHRLVNRRYESTSAPCSSSGTREYSMGT